MSANPNILTPHSVLEDQPSLGKRLLTHQTQSDASQSPRQQKRPRLDQDLTSSSDQSLLKSENLSNLIDFSVYTRDMILPKQPLLEQKFFKRHLIDVGKIHPILQNKLSDKMGRRDIQFYDLYKLNEPPQAVSELRQEGYWTEGVYDQSMYDDIEVKDFNSIFTNEDLIVQQFGKSVTVKLFKKQTVTRQVKEDLAKAKKIDETMVNERQANNVSEQARFTEKDLDLQVLTEQLANLEVKFKKTHDEIAELYVSVSGDLKKMRDVLSKKPGVVTWNYLEDLALQKPDDSQEFAVLLQEKGWQEICARRSFLLAQPQYQPDHRSQQSGAAVATV